MGMGVDLDSELTGGKMEICIRYGRVGEGMGDRIVVVVKEDIY